MIGDNDEEEPEGGVLGAVLDSVSSVALFRSEDMAAVYMKHALYQCWRDRLKVCVCQRGSLGYNFAF
jgi:hypothetical protein